jgi:succinylarginine dihydrolase
MSRLESQEVNFDGLVGLTHNYGGLSHGNVASTINAGHIANPRAAALQGLQKMKSLADMGLAQGVLPPHERPYLPTLRRLGFIGDDKTVFANAWRQAPQIAQACMSAAAMWVANAATVSPSPDTKDGLTHFTPANLNSMFHRSIEHQTTARVLQAVFADPNRYRHHSALPAGPHFGDEGAANHTRFCADYGSAGVELFVYGRHGFKSDLPQPKRFPARQTFEASRAVSNLHALNPERTVFAQQNPKTIDAGVFHNDVISVGDRNVFLFHEEAFLNQENVLAEIQQKMGDTQMHFLMVPSEEVDVSEAVSTYLFNSQVVQSHNKGTTIIAPLECQNSPSVKSLLDRLIEDDNPIQSVEYVDLRQSMKNGGGPACLRLRVVMSPDDIANTSANVIMNDNLYEKLSQWVAQHYRETLAAEDLRDPNLITECQAALDELTQLLNIGSVYDFQRM